MTDYNWRFVWKGRYNSLVELRNVFYYRNQNAALSDTIIQTQLSDMGGEGLFGQLSDKVVYREVDVSQWTGPADGIWWDSTLNGGKGGPKAEPPWSQPTTFEITDATGTVTGDDLGPMVAYCIYAKTNVKRVIPKKYFSGIPESCQALGIPSGSVLVALANVAATWATGFTYGANHFASYSWGPKRGFQAITSASVHPFLSTQRRRQYQRGI